MSIVATLMMTTMGGAVMVQAAPGGGGGPQGRWEQRDNRQGPPPRDNRGPRDDRHRGGHDSDSDGTANTALGLAILATVIAVTNSN